jgi:hypothetical protein
MPCRYQLLACCYKGEWIIGLAPEIESILRIGGYTLNQVIFFFDPVCALEPWLGVRP